MSKIENLRGLIYDMSSEDYHSRAGIYSSSQMKDLLEDPEVFYRKYITKEQEKISIPAFDVGTYFHTGVLEPHKLQSDTAIYTGIRRGKEWDKFQEDNKGKCIITKSESEQAEGLVTAVRNSPVAMGRIGRGQPEVSAFSALLVCGSEIFSEDGSKVLGKYGWEQAKKKPKKDAILIPVKVRADLLAETFILDLKSTSGNAKSEKAMKMKISDYCYDLSAAMYLDIFSIVCEREISEFVWTFASKDYFNCRSYIASQKNIQVGRAKFRKAILTLAECIATNWAFEDTLGILEPNMWELEHLNPKAEELL